MKRNLSILFSLMLILSFLVTGCSAPKNKTSGLKDDMSLEIVANGETFTISKEDLLSRELVEIKTTNINSAGDVSEVVANGFSLNAILKEKGIDLYTSTSVNMTADDGYVMAAPVSEYKDDDIYILIDLNGEELEYPRSCLPGKRSMYWVSSLNKVEIMFNEVAGKDENTSVSSGDVTEIQFFAENGTKLAENKLKNGEMESTSYSLKEYFDKYLNGECADQLIMKASDGFEKTETKEVFLTNYVTYEAVEGESPLYFSETIKKGMTVKQLSTVISNNTAIYFPKEASLSDLFKTIGMTSAESYEFVAADGFSVSIPSAAIEFGKVFTDDEGCLRVKFEGYDLSSVKGKGNVKFLSKIVANVTEAKEDEKESANSEEKFLTFVIDGKEKNLSKEEFLSLEQMEKKLSKTNSKGVTTTGTYKGVHWTKIAEHFSITTDKTIVCVASDGYEVTLTSDIINDKDSLFALYENGEEIKSSDNGYIWFAASENFTANNWVKYVVKVVVQ